MIALLLSLISSFVYGAINCPIDKENKYIVHVEIVREDGLAKSRMLSVEVFPIFLRNEVDL